MLWSSAGWKNTKPRGQSLAEGSVSWSQHGHNSVTVMLNLRENLSTEKEIQINGITGPAHSTRLTLPAPPPSGQESQEIDLENAPSHDN